MIALRRLLCLVLVAAVALCCAVPLAGPFRSEDYLAFDAWSRMGLLDVWTRPHLDMRLYGYWRPLSDSATWLAVNGLGPRPVPIHALLLALHVAVAVATGAALRRLVRASAGAGLAASLIAASHPWAAAVVSYLDGGMGALLAALATLGALAALGRWLDREGGFAPLFLATLAAGLAYDAAVVLPVVVLVVACVLPRRERGPPWALLLVLPLLLALRWWAVGQPFDGYRFPAEAVALFPSRLLLCLQRLFLPFFAEHGGPRATVIATLAVVALTAVVIAVVTRRGVVATPARQGIALLLLCTGLLGYAPDLFVGGRGEAPDELVLAYKSYPAAMAAALTIAGLLGRSSGRRGLGSIVLALPIVAAFAAFGAPIRDEQARAQEWAGAIPAAIADHARRHPAEGTRRFLVREVPVKVELDGRSGARVLQFGLSSALRPPLHAPELHAYPVFRLGLDGFGAWVSPATLDALAGVGWLEPLTCTYAVDASGRERASVAPLARPSSAAPPAVRLFADLDGRERVVADLADAPRVEVAPDSSIVLAASGRAPGTPRFFFLNRLHPFTSETLDLLPPGEVERVRIGSPWLRELAHRFPDDVTFVVLEFLATPEQLAAGAPAATVSNVIAIRLGEVR